MLAAHSRRTTTTHPTNNDPWTITSYENLV
ncbi:hypothetical protein ABH941_007958 [Streptacidiphilus sp. EB103A]